MEKSLAQEPSKDTIKQPLLPLSLQSLCCEGFMRPSCNNEEEARRESRTDCLPTRGKRPGAGSQGLLLGEAGASGFGQAAGGRGRSLRDDQKLERTIWSNPFTKTFGLNSPAMVWVEKHCLSKQSKQRGKTLLKENANHQALATLSWARNT